MNTDVTFNMVVVDGVTPTFERVTSAEGRYERSALSAEKATQAQNISFMSQMVAVAGIYRGIGVLTSSMQTLGMISDGTAMKLQKVHAAVGLVAGAFSIMKSAIAITRALTGAEAALAAVEGFRAALKNPMMLGAVALGLAATAAVGYGSVKAYQHYTGDTTNVTQNISMGGGAQVPAGVRRSQARSMYESGGG